jgi:hypothetical protein
LGLGLAWALHTFHTVTTALMLFWYLRHRSTAQATATRGAREGRATRGAAMSQTETSIAARRQHHGGARRRSASTALWREPACSAVVAAATLLELREMAMTQPSSGPAGETFRLMYRSRSTLSEADRRIELGKIFSTARSNNKRKDVTGALLLTEHWFVQTLEGDEPTVRGLFSRIETDPRHDEVVLLEAVPVGDRVFSRWAMAKVAADGEPDIPLIAGSKGATAAAGRGSTSEQDAVLDVMRAAAQPDAVQPQL